MSAPAAAAPLATRWRPTPLVSGSVGWHCMAGMGALVAPDAWPWALGALAANHVLLGAAGMWPRGAWLGPNMTRLPAAARERREIAITFDDGPDPDLTPRVLDLLEARGLRASFFCIAERAQAHPDLCREIARRGHGVENHSLRHSAAFALQGLGGFRREIGGAQRALEHVTGRAPRFFRAPAGLRNPLLDPVLHELGLGLVSWTRRGFDTWDASREAVLARLARDLDAGDILLLHDGHAARDAHGAPVLLEVLPRLLDTAAARGLHSVPLHQAVVA